jgi:beta-phosphoglucomutase-like phosphatase (HAD superfamily)
MFKEEIKKYLAENQHARIQLKSVLFDMDGVLFNSMPYHADAWHKVMASRGLELSHTEAYMHEGRTGAGTINWYINANWDVMLQKKKYKRSIKIRPLNSTNIH